MNKIGIIFAMYEELEAMLKLVKLNKVNKIYDLDFYECTINDKECNIVTKLLSLLFNDDQKS